MLVNNLNHCIFNWSKRYKNKLNTYYEKISGISDDSDIIFIDC